MDHHSSLGHLFLSALKYFIVLGMFAAGAFLYARLPDTIPTHWNIVGQVDSTSAKSTGTWFIPFIALLMAVLFPVLSKIDPKRENYASFAHAWDVLQLCFVAFFAYIYAFQLYTSLHPSPASPFVGRYVTFGIGALFIVIGNYMGKIRQNWFIGLRTPWSLSDPEVWAKSQRFGGWAFVLGGLAIIAQALFAEVNPWIFFGIVLAISVLPIIASYVLYRRKNGAR